MHLRIFEIVLALGLFFAGNFGVVTRLQDNDKMWKIEADENSARIGFVSVCPANP